MRYTFFYLFLISLFSSFALTSTAQNTFKVTKASSIGYLEYLPKGYNNNSDKYPIVIFLHGKGEKGPNTTIFDKLKNAIAPVERNGLPKLVKRGTDFPFILISPQLKSNYGDWPASYVYEIIDYCKTYLRIDERRIYLTGLSLGGGGVWVTAEDRPELFAAVAPICGSKNSGAKAQSIASEGLPVWAFHGDKDPVVPMARTVKMVNAINDSKPAPRPMAKVTIYPGVKHNAWDNAYEPDHKIHNVNLYDWMMSYTNTQNKGNLIPIAKAGGDINVNAKSITLTGSGSDGDGSIVSFAWTKLSGPSATLSNANSAQLSVSNLVAGTYVFKFQVTDNADNTDSDYVKITVGGTGPVDNENEEENGNSEINIPPVVNAGIDKIITLPDNTITITGTASDGDGNITSYAWTKTSGKAVKWSGENTSSLKVSSLEAGEYVFRLTVKDDKGAIKSDDILVTVKPKPTPTNHAPYASAGPDRIVKLPASAVTLFGMTSDPDGKVVTIKWTKVSGGACSISNPNLIRPKVSGFEGGTYVFRLTVSDDHGAVSTDEITIIFDRPPVANAGVDKRLTLPNNSIVLHGTGNDREGVIKHFRWSKVSGPHYVVLENKETANVSISRLRAGTYVFKLIVMDEVGLEGIDYVTVRIGESKSGRSESDDQFEEESETLVNEANSQSTPDFALSSIKETEDCTATIYDQNGRTLYNGKWSNDLYKEIFSQQGLYIYHVVKDGKKQIGKIYIAENQ